MDSIFLSVKKTLAGLFFLLIKKLIKIVIPQKEITQMFGNPIIYVSQYPLSGISGGATFYFYLTRVEVAYGFMGLLSIAK